MMLTDFEKALLNGDRGGEARRLMEIMLKVGEINGADEWVDVKQVMIGNTGMMSVAGETGIDFLCKLADAGIQFRVPTYTNVVSMDLRQWKELGISNDYAATQFKAIEAWKKMGAVLSCSCMPFSCGAAPRYQEHVAYADTATVIFGNSFFGARSNRESDLICLGAAVCGRVPKFGYHLVENRLGRVAINVDAQLHRDSDYDALGYHLGRIVKDRVPVFKNLDKNISVQALIQLGAALASTGTVALFHCEGITPEVKQDSFLYGVKGITEEIEVTEEDIKNTYAELNAGGVPEIDLVFLGCPHCTLEKLRQIADRLDGKRIHDNLKVWRATSSAIRHLASRSDGLRKIERAGAVVLCDTCAVIAPTRELGYRTIATDSSKAQVYLSDLGFNIGFGTTDECLEAALRGHWGT